MRGTAVKLCDPAAGGAGQHAIDPEPGEVRAGADGPRVRELTPQPFAGPVGRRRVDVGHRVPGRLAELSRAGHGITGQQALVAAQCSGLS